MPPPQRAAPFAETLHHDIYSAISPDGTLANSVIGLTVVITGAGRGIGRAQALTFAKAGAKVVVLAARSIHELDEVEAAVGKAAPSTKVVKVTTDVSDEESVKRLFESVEEVHGRYAQSSISTSLHSYSSLTILVLINNAGYMEPRKRIHEASTSDWWRAYEVNVMGTFLPTRQVIRIALSRPQRPINLTIINTSSIASHLTSPGGSGYQTTKSVVNRFTEFVHFEYEAEGIRAFAYHPGDCQSLLLSPTAVLMCHMQVPS
jgi:NAD(P)-dependent dehydrogenase (short-subunit alcohol dehydrogenase family)